MKECVRLPFSLLFFSQNFLDYSERKSLVGFLVPVCVQRERVAEERERRERVGLTDRWTERES